MLLETKRAIRFRQNNRTHSTLDYVEIVMSKSEYDRLPIKHKQHVNTLANMVMNLTDALQERQKKLQQESHEAA